MPAPSTAPTATSVATKGRQPLSWHARRTIPPMTAAPIAAPFLSESPRVSIRRTRSIGNSTRRLSGVSKAMDSRLNSTIRPRITSPESACVTHTCLNVSWAATGAAHNNTAETSAIALIASPQWGRREGLVKGLRRRETLAADDEAGGRHHVAQVRVAERIRALISTVNRAVVAQVESHTYALREESDRAAADIEAGEIRPHVDDVACKRRLDVALGDADHAKAARCERPEKVLREPSRRCDDDVAHEDGGTAGVDERARVGLKKAGRRGGDRFGAENPWR